MYIIYNQTTNEVMDIIVNPQYIKLQDNGCIVICGKEDFDAITKTDGTGYWIILKDSKLGEINCTYTQLSDLEASQYLINNLKSETVTMTKGLEKEVTDSQLAITEIFEMISTMGG